MDKQRVQPALSVGYMRNIVGQDLTAGEQTQQKPCRTSSDIGTELENYTVGRGPM
jgi:hypothetical protein